MVKIIYFLIFLFFTIIFVFYQIKLQKKKSYIIENGIPYFKSENDILKIYDLKNHDEENVALKATIYDAISKDSKAESRIESQK
jgi:hypothetical protein